METAHVVRKSCKYHVQETYFVWSLVSEIYGKEKGGEVTLYFFSQDPRPACCWNFEKQVCLKNLATHYCVLSFL